MSRRDKTAMSRRAETTELVIRRKGILQEMLLLSRAMKMPVSIVFVALGLLGLLIQERRENPWIQPYFYAHF